MPRAHLELAPDTGRRTLQSGGSVTSALFVGLLWQGALPAASRAQIDPPPEPGTERVLVTPGEAYAAGGAHRGLFGSGYRDLWVTPIEVPVVDLSSFAGGVVPNRVGGGMTTRTLHLDGADGRRYVFRSVDKSPVEFEDFEGSILEDVIQDQVSSFHPSGAPVVARLLEEIGGLHTDPIFAVVPDDPVLEEFRKEFAGLLVLVEERPDDGPDGSAGFAGSRRIVQTDDLFEELEENAHHHVDAEDLLRVRLVDILVGDRDRSHNNHLWAGFETDSGTVWRVIPRDRDQAFVRFDGFLKSLARMYDRRLVTFTGTYPDVFALTRNAWDIDRRLLVGLDRGQWSDVVRSVQEALTDDVLAEAVRQMPPEHVAVMGEQMTEELIRRRDQLPQAAEKLYRVVFSSADVHGTDADEDVTITRHGDGRVTVDLTLTDGTTKYHRVFVPGETSEIRVYLHGGDDEVILDGGGADGMLVRVIGGGGRDTFDDRRWGSSSNTLIYDGGDGTRFPVDGSARVQRSSPSPPFSWLDERRELDWGTLTIPQPTASYDGDRGLVIVPGLEHERYGFGKQPYSSRIRTRAGWAFGLNEPIFDFRYLARDALVGSDFSMQFRWSGIEIINFYGLGNETPTTGPTSFHRVAHKQVTATLAAGVGDGERRFLEVGPTFTYTSTDTTDAASFIAAIDPYGSGKFAHAGARLAFGVDTRDHVGTPTRGWRLEGGVSVHPEVLDAVAGFREAHGNVSAYFSPGGGNPVLAIRAAGKRVWGTAPFTELAFLGGPGSVRSLREQRYAGEAMVLGSADLRVKLVRMIFPIPSDVGVFALSDVGRVFLPGGTSDVWHSAVGGGIWFALVNRSNVVRVSLSRGDEWTALNAGVGFSF